MREAYEVTIPIIRSKVPPKPILVTDMNRQTMNLINSKPQGGLERKKQLNM